MTTKPKPLHGWIPPEWENMIYVIWLNWRFNWLIHVILWCWSLSVINNSLCFCNTFFHVSYLAWRNLFSGFLFPDVRVPRGKCWLSDVSPCCPPLSPRYQGEVGCHEYPQSPCHPTCHRRVANVTLSSTCCNAKHKLWFPKLIVVCVCYLLPAENMSFKHL